MWASVFRMTRWRTPKRPRHAAQSAPVSIPRQRTASPVLAVPATTPRPDPKRAPLSAAGSMQRRPVTTDIRTARAAQDWANPAAPDFHPRDGHTAVQPVMRTVTPPEAQPAESLSDTMTLADAADIVSPERYYSDDADCDWGEASTDGAPSLLGSGQRLANLPSGYICTALRVLTNPQAQWFRPCVDNGGKYANDLNAFHAERERADAARDRDLARLNSRWVRPRTGGRTSVLDTSVFQAVVAAEFAPVAGQAVSR